MGCHTWFSVPFITDKEKIKQDALEELERKDYAYSAQEKKMYQYAIEQDLDDIIARLASNNSKYENVGLIQTTDGKLYKDSAKYHDAFRCSGYPIIVLKSLQETIDFINSYEYKHRDGTVLKCETSEHTIPTITEFFEKYPDGIITFG